MQGEHFSPPLPQAHSLMPTYLPGLGSFKIRLLQNDAYHLFTLSCFCQSQSVLGHLSTLLTPLLQELSLYQCAIRNTATEEGAEKGASHKLKSLKTSSRATSGGAKHMGGQLFPLFTCSPFPNLSDGYPDVNPPGRGLY